MTLQGKINELVEQYHQINRKIELILIDVSYLNDETPEYNALLQERAKLAKRIWILKNNW